MLIILYIPTMKSPLTAPARSRLALLGGAACGGAALTLFHLGAETVLGIEANKAAFALLWLALPLGLIGLSLLPPGHAPSALTMGEKRALILLAVTLLAGAWLFMTLQSIGWDADPRDRRLTQAVLKIIALLVTSRILLTILRRREIGKTAEDERDAAIRQRAASVGYRTLAILLVIFAVSVGYSFLKWYPLSPLAISHTVIGILLLSEAARYAAEAGFYRHDRT